MNIWYTNISDISEKEFNNFLRVFPIGIQDVVMRYNFFLDRKLKLFARVIIQAYLDKNQVVFSWDNWELKSGGKPYVSNEVKFNISHSGSFVLVAFSSHEIGIDIEKKTPVNYLDIQTAFHQMEIDCINDSNEPLDDFYKIWTRKEAFLKATGIGIVDGLNHQNCLQDTIGFGRADWHIYSIDLIPDYACAICQNASIEKISIKEFTTKELQRHV